MPSPTTSQHPKIPGRSGPTQASRTLAAYAIRKRAPWVLIPLLIAASAASHSQESAHVLSFDGTGAYVSVPNIPFDRLDAFTVETWVMDWTGPILCQGQAGDPENSIWVSLGSRANVGCPHESCGWEAGRGANVEGAVGTGLPNEWNHVAMVYSDGLQRLYLNGEMLSEKRCKRPGPLDASRPLLVGAHHYSRDWNFGSGKLGWLRISKTARYHAPFTPPGDTQVDDDCLALFDFSVGNGDRLPDLSQAARHGTIVGARWTGNIPQAAPPAADLVPTEPIIPSSPEPQTPGRPLTTLLVAVLAFLFGGIVMSRTHRDTPGPGEDTP